VWRERWGERAIERESQRESQREPDFYSIAHLKLDIKVDDYALEAKGS